ncbi:unnamed protein product [Prorocentrum cordatum]|uniref:Uncharacterized protein n=1 Tax=Prorocentrum cordatum TaxID=2364126 RepID=A0ABN9TRW1_9DINO|nr:unnamed protein product [Polarella glacialis]
MSLSIELGRCRDLDRVRGLLIRHGQRLLQSFHLCRHLRQERVVVRQARGMFTELSIDIINANDQLMSKFIHLRR